MSSKLTSITLNTALLNEMLQFYRLIGVEFTATAVAKGGQVYRAQIGALEFSLISVPNVEKKQTPAMQLSFSVADLEDRVQKLGAVQGAMSILEPTEMPDGKKAIWLDPEGRAVELCETRD